MSRKSIFLEDLREHQDISDIFLATHRQVSVGKTNRPYLRLTLADSTGQIEGRMWEGAEQAARRFDSGALVHVEARVTSYQNQLQLNVEHISPLSPEEVASSDWSDFMPSALRPTDEMLAELKQLLSTIDNPHLKALVDSFLENPQFVEGFVNSPAAKGVHHVYVGGLLEHTLNVLGIANFLGERYPVNRDLLLTGAFLHDIGKFKELTFGAGFDYTDEGRLVGHIYLGTSMVRERAQAIEDFPHQLLTHLEHMVLSHHGELEWGSPKRPKTLEAMALHLADNIDAKLQMALEIIDRDSKDDSLWSPYSRLLGRALFRPPLEGAVIGNVAHEEFDGVEAELMAAFESRSGSKENETAEEEPAADPTALPGQKSFGF